MEYVMIEDPEKEAMRQKLLVTEKALAEARQEILNLHQEIEAYRERIEQKQSPTRSHGFHSEE